jgi:DNA-binding beta-propeller fold protein YncE
MPARVKLLLSGCAVALALAAPAIAQTSRGLAPHAQSDLAAARPDSPVEHLLQAGRARIQPAAVKTTLNYPYGLTVDNAGNLYAANLFGGVTICNAKLQYQGAITTGTDFPAAVGVNFEGNIFVANNESGAITIYNPAWQQIGTITDPNLTSPTNLYIDPDDTIWVLDGQGIVHAYLANYTPLPTTETGGTALGPWGSNMTVWGI